MAKIVAFSVPSLVDGERALEELDRSDAVHDVALVHKTADGRVKLRQTSDVTAGRGAVRGALLGALASIVSGPVGGMAVAGAAGGTVLSALGDRGIDNKLMKLAGEEMAPGQATVFVMAEDAGADKIVATIERLSNLRQYAGVLDVIDFPADAQKAVRDQIRTEHEALIGA